MDSNETKVYIAILIAVSILGILLIFFFSTLIKHQRKNVQLNQEKVKVEISTLEAERKRVASDLHDDLGPFLSSIKLQINLLNTKDDEDILAIKEIGAQIDGILEKVRETSNNLMPNVLIRKGLIVAINNFVKRINNTSKLVINAFLPDNLHLPEEMEVNIYRIFQEGVHNALKHSNASTFKIKLEIKEPILLMTMADNGKGFDLDAILKESVGIGLKSIANRVDLLKGEFFLDTRQGHGTTFTIEIPMN